MEVLQTLIENDFGRSILRVGLWIGAGICIMSGMQWGKFKVPGARSALNERIRLIIGTILLIVAAIYSFGFKPSGKISDEGLKERWIGKWLVEDKAIEQEYELQLVLDEKDRLRASVLKENRVFGGMTNIKLQSNQCLWAKFAYTRGDGKYEIELCQFSDGTSFTGRYRSRHYEEDWMDVIRGEKVE